MPAIELTEPQRKAAVNAIVNKHATANAVAASKKEADDLADEEQDTSKAQALSALLTASGGSSNDLLQSVLLELAQSMREDRERRAEDREVKRAAQQEKLDEFNRLKAAQVENVRALHERERITQSRCTHVKENGSTRLAGQRMHNGDLVLLCNFCHKTFTNDEIPAHLWPRGEAMGLDGTS